MALMKETLLKIQTDIIYTLITGSMKLPDSVLAELISTTYAIANVLTEKKDDEILLRLEELEGYFRGQSELSEALRKIFTDARPSQVKSMIRGYLVNYIYDW